MSNLGKDLLIRVAILDCSSRGAFDRFAYLSDLAVHAGIAFYLAGRDLAAAAAAVAALAVFAAVARLAYKLAEKVIRHVVACVAACAGAGDLTA